MANPDHVARLKAGVEEWNRWRTTEKAHPDLAGSSLAWRNLKKIDLTNANLAGCHLEEANLEESELSGACLEGADLRKVDLQGARLDGSNLRAADLTEGFLADADFRRADLSKADLTEARLIGADLRGALLQGAILRLAVLGSASLRLADLSGADLSGAFLNYASLIKTNLTNANLTGCKVYGVSVWDVQLDGAIQHSLVLTEPKDSPIEADSLEVAQFLHLLLNNGRIRSVIDSITSKVVLILGRFTPERKIILDAIRDELRKRDYLPVLFDFDKPANRDVTETVSTLAHMAKFVIADITDAKSIPQELMAIVPALPSVPVQPLLLASQREYGMFEHFRRFPWVLEPYLYDDQDRLLAAITDKVIGPAEAKAKEQTGR